MASPPPPAAPGLTAPAFVPSVPPPGLSSPTAPGVAGAKPFVPAGGGVNAKPFVPGGGSGNGGGAMARSGSATGMASGVHAPIFVPGAFVCGGSRGRRQRQQTHATF